MVELVELTKISDIPAKGNPAGMVLLSQITPSGDRGLVFGRSDEDGIPLGKIPGYWSCPYAGTITGVILNTDQGGYTVKFWKSPSGRSPTSADLISIDGYTIPTPVTHIELFDTSDFLFIDVLPGDTFAVEITAVDIIVPTDISGNLLMLKTEEAP